MLTINKFSIPPLVAGFLILAIGAYIFLINRRSRVHRYFAYFCVTLFAWLACFHVMYNAPDAVAAYDWARNGFVAIAFIPVVYLLFILSLLKEEQSRFLAVTLTLLASIFALLGKRTDLIYQGMTTFFWGYYPVAGWLYAVFMVYYATVWLYGLRLLLVHMREMKAKKDYIQYNQSKYIFFAFLGGSIGIVDFIAKYNVPIYPFAYVCALYWVLIISFSLRRYKMLTDFSFLSRRILIASGMAGAILGIFGVVHWVYRHSALNALVQPQVWIGAVSCLTGLLLGPLYRQIKNLIDRSFYQEYFQRKEKIARIEQEILLAKDVLEFSRIILNSLFSSFNITKGSIYLWREDEGAYLLNASSGPAQGADRSVRVEKSEPIARLLEHHDHLWLEHLPPELDVAAQRALSLTMLCNDAELYIPLRAGRLLGFLTLGSKESGLPYVSEDLKTLRKLAEPISRALENIDLLKKWEAKSTQADTVTHALHRYLSPTVADEVINQVQSKQQWKGDKRHVSILVADLRGFTKLSEKYGTEEIVEWLNEYFSKMIDIIMSHSGTVDKFMGDGVLAVFGAPALVKDHELKALRCALDMQSELGKLNRRRVGAGLVPLEMGVSLASGYVISGNIGSDRRMEYTVIGEPVNVAARLQTYAGAGKIIATTHVVEPDKVKESILFTPHGRVTIRGKPTPVEIVSILGAKDLGQAEQDRSEKDERRFGIGG